MNMHTITSSVLWQQMINFQSDSWMFELKAEIE